MIQFFRKIWSFQQINEGGSCNVQKKFPKTIADLTEMNRSLQTLKLEHALETNGSSCAKDSITSSNSNEEGGGGSTNCSSSSRIINKTKRDTPTTNDYSFANDDSSLISGNNKEDGSTSGSSSTLGNNKEGGSTSNKTRNYSSGDDTSSDDDESIICSNNGDSISYYKSKCRFIIATAQSCGTSSVHEPDEAVLLKCLKADIAYFKKEYGSWKLSTWKERMKKFIKIPEWTGAYDYQYTREFKESKQNIIHYTRFVVKEAEKILENYNDKKPMTVNAIQRKAKRDGWEKFAEFAKEQRKKWRNYQEESRKKWFQQQCDTISDLLQTQVQLETTTSVSSVRLCI